MAGVHSPMLSGSSQVNTFRPLRLPTILVASHHLGGISSTLSAYESLILRGYDIDALLCFEESYYENWKYLDKWAMERSIPLGLLPKPPEGLPNRTADMDRMRGYYQNTASQTVDPRLSLGSVVQALQKRHQRRLSDLDTAPRRTLDAVWWPFVQHAHVTKGSDVMVIDSAYEDHFEIFSPVSSQISTDEGRAESSANMLIPTFDGSASWWTQCLGHANTDLAMEAARAAGRYGHVLFPMATHLPALELAERVLNTVGKGWADKVYFSDNGSTAIEVALKMALRYTAKELRESSSSTEGGKVELGVLGLNGSYHGDTIGAMDASEGGVYSRSVEWYRGRGFWLDPPTIKIEEGKPVIRFEGEQWQGVTHPRAFETIGQVYDVEARLAGKGASEQETLASIYRRHISRLADHAQDKLGINFGVLILEPVVMGAGGMLFVDPLFHRVLVDFVRESLETRLPVIFDDVFVGLYRLGRISGSSFIGTTPDIACYAKILTGGLLPMAVTLANQKIFDVFLGNQKQEALLHGHSYTAHPVGCAVANKSLEIATKLDEEDPHWNGAKEAWSNNDGGEVAKGENSAIFSLWSKDFVDKVSRLNGVDGTMALGTLLVIYLRDLQNAGTYTRSQLQNAADRSIYRLSIERIGITSESPSLPGCIF